MPAPTSLRLNRSRGITAPPTNKNGPQRYNISLNCTATASLFKTETQGRNLNRARNELKQPRSPPPADPSAPPISPSPAPKESPHSFLTLRHWKTRATPSNMTAPSKHASPSAVTCAPSKKDNFLQKSSQTQAPWMRPRTSLPNSSVTPTPRN